jgi:hypothetical protein
MLNKIATEGSTYVVTATFKDEAGEAVTPSGDVVWTLYDSKATQISTGTVGAAASVDIVIQGDDLVLPSNTKDEQILTLVVETTYDSTIGDDNELVEVETIRVKNNPGVS